MHSNFFSSLFIAIIGFLLTVDALPRPLNMQATPSLTPSLSPSPSPSATPFTSPTTSFSPSITPSPSSSSSSSASFFTPTASPPFRNDLLDTSSSTATTTSAEATATALTAADLNMLSTVTGLLGGLASLLGLA